MKDYEKWFEQARHDFEVAEYNFNGDFFDSCVFYCQQVVEKLLKALLIRETKEFPKIHDLVILSRKIELPNKFMDKMKDLNGAYIESRYIVSSGKIPAKLFGKGDAKEFLVLAKEVLKWAES